jgi:hypothetical protein
MPDSQAAPKAHSFNYDVTISLPEHAGREAVLAHAKQALASTPEVVERIMRALDKHRMAKVKSAVPREKAEKVAKKFEAMGFRAEISPSLKIELSALEEAPQAVAETIECPACSSMVQPDSLSKCPNCGVYINKLTPAILERKRQQRQEKELKQAKLRSQQEYNEHMKQREAEARLRDELRQEVERKFQREQERNRQQTRIAVSVLLLAGCAAAFWGGRASKTPAPPTALASPALPAAPSEDDIQKVLRQTSQLQRDMAHLSGTVAQTDGAVKIDARDSLLASPDPAQGAPLSDAAKYELGNALVLLLAEIGQIERARELIEKIVSRNRLGNDFALVSQLRSVQLQVEAWSIMHGHSDRAQEQIETLTRMVGEIPEPVERTLAAADIGAILLLRPDFQPQATEPLFRQADEAYKLAKDKNPQVGHALLVARGRGILNSAQARLERGMRQQATDLTGQLDTMARLAPESSVAVLHGFNQRLAHLMGNADGAQQNMEQALLKIRQNPSPAQQARQLRAIIDLDNYTHKNLQAALAALVSDASKRGGTEGAAVLLEAGQIYAKYGNDDGWREIQNKLQAQAKASPATAPYEERLRGLAEVALAYRAKRNADPALLEVHLRQVAALLNQNEAGKP